MLLVVLSSAVLVGLVSVAKQFSLEAIVICLAAPLVTGFVLAALIRTTDPKSVASARRLFGLFFVSTIIWIIPMVLGVFAYWITGVRAVTNEFVFGAFLAWGFECVVISGAFVKNILTSLVLGAVHPLSILLVTLSAGVYQHLYPPLTGIAALILMTVFLLRLQTIKTKQGTPSLQVLQAFLKTWVVHEPTDLENHFVEYATIEPVATDVMLAESGGKKVAFVLPGVHPGPFYPVGSYNLSELIYRSLRDNGLAPVVLHGTGGHERNTPTNTAAATYADEISKFVNSLGASSKGLMRGPAYDKVGITNITTLAFGKSVLSIISNSPFLSDDLDPAAITEASSAAAKLGLTLSMVDAHNSVNGERRPQPTITSDDWESILSRVLALPEREFSMGFANSNDMKLKLASDVSEGGICAAIFAANETKSVLISADSNNAVSGLRERIADELAKGGVRLIELCTSDTHNFAARNLIGRGYFALGEQSGIESIVDGVERLVSAALSTIAPCNLTVARFETKTRLIGSNSLDDFAELTKKAISLSKTYAKAISLASLLLMAITLFY